MYLGLFAKAQDSYDSDTLQGRLPETFADTNGNPINLFEVADVDVTQPSKLAVNVDVLNALFQGTVVDSDLLAYAKVNGDDTVVFHVKEDLSVSSALNQTRADQLYLKQTDIPAIPGDVTLWLNGSGAWLPNPNSARWVTEVNDLILLPNSKTLIDAGANPVIATIRSTNAIYGDTIEVSVIGDANLVTIKADGSESIDGDMTYEELIVDRQFHAEYVYIGNNEWVISHKTTEQMDDIELDSKIYDADSLLALKENHSYMVPVSMVRFPDTVERPEAQLGLLFGIDDVAVAYAELVRSAGNTYELFLSNGTSRALVLEDNQTPIEFKSGDHDTDLIVGDEVMINGNLTNTVAQLEDQLSVLRGETPYVTTAKEVMRVVTNGEEFSFIWDHTLWLPTNCYDNTALDPNNSARLPVGSFATTFKDFSGAAPINDKALGYAQISAGVYVPIIDQHGYHLTGRSVKALIANSIGAIFTYDNSNIVISEVFTSNSSAVSVVTKEHLATSIMYGSCPMPTIEGALTQMTHLPSSYQSDSTAVTVDALSGILHINKAGLYEIDVDVTVVLTNEIAPGDEGETIIVEAAHTHNGTTTRADIIDIITANKHTKVYKKQGKLVEHFDAGADTALAVRYSKAITLDISAFDVIYKITHLN
ncbi:MAG: hypothetical protein DRP62_08175 [Planctomycetota bacterium]|nr:MAG: hypothetical protein DRP62_08175 [Planctomycetota bacterium]